MIFEDVISKENQLRDGKIVNCRHVIKVYLPSSKGKPDSRFESDGFQSERQILDEKLLQSFSVNIGNLKRLTAIK